MPAVGGSSQRLLMCGFVRLTANLSLRARQRSLATQVPALKRPSGKCDCSVAGAIIID
jgi:hypothetical protein